MAVARTFPNAPFGHLKGLREQSIPDYRAAFQRGGMTAYERHPARRFLAADLWQSDGTWAVNLDR